MIGGWDERQVTGEGPYRRPYWYVRYIDECPVCGRVISDHRERVYKKPKPEERIHLTQSGCYGCFMGNY